MQRYSIPLAEVATPSFEALKAYALGRSLWWEKGEAVAIPEMLRAVDLDPEFSSAYSALASMCANMGQATRAAEFMKKSYSLREKSGERERFRIEAFYHDYVEGDVYQSIHSLELWQRSYPRDRMSSLNNGFQHMKLGRWDRALAHSEFAAETEASVIIISNLAIILLALERHADARGADRSRRSTRGSTRSSCTRSPTTRRSCARTRSRCAAMRSRWRDVRAKRTCSS